MLTVSINHLHSNRFEIARYIPNDETCNAGITMQRAESNVLCFCTLMRLKAYWLAKERGFTCPELEALTHEKLAPLYVKLLEAFALGRKADKIVQPVIDLHKRIAAGELVPANQILDLRTATARAWVSNYGNTTQTVRACMEACMTLDADWWGIAHHYPTEFYQHVASL